MADVNISKYTTQVVRGGSKPASPGFVVSEGQNPVDPAGSGQNHLPVTIGSPANGLAVTEAQVLTIDKAQIFAGTSSQFVKGDGTLDSNTYLTTGSASATYVPYTGATADVNLGTHDLAAERGTFENNGSSDALTVTHTSGSGYGIIVTKGGNNEALYVEKTSGSGNAMTVVGGRTSLVDLALSSVSNTAGDFLTLSGGVVHKRTAAQVLTDIGGQAALTNPVTGTGTTNYLPKFTGTSTIGNSQVIDNGNQVGVGLTPNASYGTFQIKAPAGVYSLDLVGRTAGLNGESQITFWNSAQSSALAYLTNTASNLYIGTGANQPFTLSSGGNFIFGSTTDAGYKLDVNGTGRFSGVYFATNDTPQTAQATITRHSVVGLVSRGVTSAVFDWSIYSAGGTALIVNPTGTNNINFNGGQVYFTGGSVGIGTTSPSQLLHLKTELATGSGVGTAILIESGGSGGDQGWIGVNKGSGNGLEISVENRDIIFNTGATTPFGGSERMRITSGGNLLVGTTTDAGFKLDVNGTGRFTPAVSSSFPTVMLHQGTGGGSYGHIAGAGDSSHGMIMRGIPANGSTSDFSVTTGDIMSFYEFGGEFRWYQKNGTLTERMRITSGGNVGIGTTSPSGKLQVLGTAGSFIVENGGDAIVFTKNAENYISAKGGSNSSLIFETNFEGRMRITSTGNVLIGTTTDAGFKLDVNGTGRFSGNLRIEKATPLLVLNDTSGAGAQIGSFGGNLNLIDNATGTKGVVINLSTGAATFSSLGTGTVTATAGTLSTISDLTYKIDDGFIDSAIEKVLNLKPRYFYWNEKSGLPKDVRQLGFYAQEVNEALGEEAANTPQDKNTPWGISDRSIIAMLTKAIQELKQEIDTLKN